MSDGRVPTWRVALFNAAFYAVTFLMMALGIWLLIGPRRWAMAGLRLHALVSLWLLRVICGIRIIRIVA